MSEIYKEQLNSTIRVSKNFYFSFTYTVSDAFLFLVQIQVSNVTSLLFKEIFFHTSHSAGLLATNSINFCWSEKVSISPPLLNYHFQGIKLCFFSSFLHPSFNALFHSILAWMVFEEKSYIILILLLNK